MRQTPLLFSQPNLVAFTQLIATPTLPELGPGPRAGVLSSAQLEAKLAPFLAELSVNAARRGLLRGAALLWHDQHEPAHEIAQADSSAEGSFLHAILHRREPDSSNSRYWWHRTGAHRSFGQIAAALKEWATTPESRELARALLPGGRWDPERFVEECSRALRWPADDPRVRRLQEVQQLEFQAFVGSLLPGS